MQHKANPTRTRLQLVSLQRLLDNFASGETLPLQDISVMLGWILLNQYDLARGYLNKKIKFEAQIHHLVIHLLREYAKTLHGVLEVIFYLYKIDDKQAFSIISVPLKDVCININEIIKNNPNIMHDDKYYSQEYHIQDSIQDILTLLKSQETNMSFSDAFDYIVNSNSSSQRKLFYQSLQRCLKPIPKEIFMLLQFICKDWLDEINPDENTLNSEQTPEYFLGQFTSLLSSLPLPASFSDVIQLALEHIKQIHQNKINSLSTNQYAERFLEELGKSEKKPQPAKNSKKSERRRRRRAQASQQASNQHQYYPPCVASLDVNIEKEIETIAKLLPSCFVIGNEILNALLNIQDKPAISNLLCGATPDEIVKILKQHHYPCTIADGVYPVVVVALGGKILQIATFKGDPTKEAAKDCERQESGYIVRNANYSAYVDYNFLHDDFSINTFYYDLDKKMVWSCHASALTHLEERVLWTVIEPSFSLRFDPTRILSAFELMHRLDFYLSADLDAAILTYREHLQYVPQKRLLGEIRKICTGGYSQGIFNSLHQYEILPILFPPLAIFQQNIGYVELLNNVCLHQDSQVQHKKIINLSLFFATLLLPVLIDCLNEKKSFEDSIDIIFSEQKKRIFLPVKMCQQIKSIWQIHLFSSLSDKKNEIIRQFELHAQAYTDKYFRLNTELLNLPAPVIPGCLFSNTTPLPTSVLPEPTFKP